MNILNIIYKNKYIFLILIIILILIIFNITNILNINNTFENFHPKVTFKEAKNLCSGGDKGKLPIFLDETKYNETVVKYRSHNMDSIWLNMRYDPATKTPYWVTTDENNVVKNAKFTRWDTDTNKIINGSWGSGDEIGDPDGNIGIIVSIIKNNANIEDENYPKDTIELRYSDQANKENITWGISDFKDSNDNDKYKISGDGTHIELLLDENKEYCVQLNVTDDSDTWKIKECDSQLAHNKSIPVCSFAENFSNTNDIKSIQEKFTNSNLKICNSVKEKNCDWYVSSNKLTWTTANNTCKDAGKELIDIQSAAEENDIVQTLNGLNWIDEFSPIWIGLHTDSYDNGTPIIPIKWTNNSDITHTNFNTSSEADLYQNSLAKGAGYSLRYHTELSSDKLVSSWYPEQEGNQAYYICKKKLSA